MQKTRRFDTETEFPPFDNSDSATGYSQWHPETALPSAENGSLPLAVLHYDCKSKDVPFLVGMGIAMEKIHILNPMDYRAVAWDISKDVQSMTDITMLANILMPEPPPHIKEEGFFRNSGIRALKGVIEGLHYAAPGNWTLRDIVHAFEDLETLTAFLKKDPRTAKYASAFGTEGTSQNILATVVAAIHEYDIIASLYDHAKRQISLREWLQDPSVLVLGFNHEAKTTLNALNRALLSMATKLILNLPTSRTPTVLLCLDELPQLAGRIEGLKDLATLGREKGCVLALGLQSIEDLKSIYGLEIMEVITGQMNHKAILRLSEAGSASWASNLFGKMKRVRRSFSYQWQTFLFGFLNYGQRTSGGEVESLEEVVMPIEFQTIPPVDWKNNQGLTGYYVGQYRYVHTYPVSFLQESLIESDETVAEFVPAPAAWQVLRPWDDSDYTRLHFRPPDYLDSSAENGFLTGSYGCNGIGTAASNGVNGAHGGGGAMHQDLNPSDFLVRSDLPPFQAESQTKGKEKSRNDRKSRRDRNREPDRR